MQMKLLLLLVVFVGRGIVRCIPTETSSQGNESILPDLKNNSNADLQNVTLAEILKDFDDIKNGMTQLINQYRSCHNTNPLKRSSSLDSGASNWAQHMASTGQFQHSGNNGWGENIYWQSWPLGSNGADCVKAWYCECFNNYDYNSNNNSPSCGHFTQLVWKGSSSIGLGIAKGSRGYYVVANFDPPGNFGGRYKDNVSQPNKSCVNNVGSCQN